MTHDARCCRLVLVADYIAYDSGMWDEADGVPPAPPHDEAAKAGVSEAHMQQVSEGMHQAVPRIESLLGVLQ